MSNPPYPSRPPPSGLPIHPWSAHRLCENSGTGSIIGDANASASHALARAHMFVHVCVPARIFFVAAPGLLRAPQWAAISVPPPVPHPPEGQGPRSGAGTLRGWSCHCTGPRPPVTDAPDPGIGTMGFGRMCVPCPSGPAFFARPHLCQSVQMLPKPCPDAIHTPQTGKLVGKVCVCHYKRMRICIWMCFVVCLRALP